MEEEIERIKIVEVVDCPRCGSIQNAKVCYNVNDPCPYFKENGEKGFIGCVFTYRLNAAKKR